MFQFPEQMKRVFKDETLQAQFERDGFVTIPFYTAEEIRELNRVYERLHPEEETGFYPSTFSNDKNYRQQADEEIRRIGNRTISEALINQKVVCGSYIVKYPGPKSKMNVHQDMTLVDESRFSGINIWVPLIDLTQENGVLNVLPGSHRIFPTYRGPTIPDLYQPVKDLVKDYMTPMYLKAGEAIIFDQSIMHYSPPNLSEQPRIVTNTYFTHKDAEYRTAYYNPDVADDKVELFEQGETFMTDFDQFGENIFDRPKIGKSLGLVDYDFPKLTPELLHQLYGDKEQLEADSNDGENGKKKEKQQNFINKILSWLR